MIQLFLVFHIQSAPYGISDIPKRNIPSPASSLQNSKRAGIVGSYTVSIIRLLLDFIQNTGRYRSTLSRTIDSVSTGIRVTSVCTAASRPLRSVMFRAGRIMETPSDSGNVHIVLHFHLRSDSAGRKNVISGGYSKRPEAIMPGQPKSWILTGFHCGGS